MEEQHTITYKQKLEVAKQLREWQPGQLVTLLDSLNENWYHLLFPTGKQKLIDCDIPKNEHKPSDTHKYTCSATSTGPHSFCLDHKFVKNKCPIDGTNLTKVQA